MRGRDEGGLGDESPLLPTPIPPPNAPPPTIIAVITHAFKWRLVGVNSVSLANGRCSDAGVVRNYPKFKSIMIGPLLSIPERSPNDLKQILSITSQSQLSHFGDSHRCSYTTNFLFNDALDRPR